jgi:hypothetical protein
MIDFNAGLRISSYRPAVTFSCGGLPAWSGFVSLVQREVREQAARSPVLVLTPV